MRTPLTVTRLLSRSTNAFEIRVCRTNLPFLKISQGRCTFARSTQIGIGCGYPCATSTLCHRHQRGARHLRQFNICACTLLRTPFLKGDLI